MQRRNNNNTTTIINYSNIEEPGRELIQILYINIDIYKIQNVYNYCAIYSKK